AEFDEKGIPALIENYVKTGKVAFEFRNFVRDPLDLTGSLITRCNGAQSFFPLTRAMYADQKNWFTKIQAIPQAEMEKVQSMTPAQQFAAMAQYAGFQSWAAQRGVPSAKSSQCLANQSEADKLVEMNSDGASTFNIPGTPAFVINGKLVKDAATWPMLEPELKKAL
ncbi:MAG: DsbA family protein, partial [Sphingomicrobium sp.]